mgnify:CR=1 FL=1
MRGMAIANLRKKMRFRPLNKLFITCIISQGIDIVGVGVVECLVGDGRGWNDRGRRFNQDIF